MKRLLPLSLSFLFLSLISFHASAQEKNPYKKTDSDIQLKGKLEGITETEMIDELMLTLPGFGSGVRNALTEQSVKNFMMPPRTLGKRGSNISYTIAACLEFYTNFGENYKVNLSPDYISLSIPKEREKILARDAFNFLAENGTVSAAIMPFDAAAISTGVYATEKYTIDNFLHVINADLPKRQKIFEARKALMRGNPIVIDLFANNEFTKIENEKFWTPSALNEEAKNFPLLVVGFDQSQEAFEVFNPWSPTWGNNGYLWIHYNDFGKFVVNGFVIVPTSRPQ